jgi:hypothetical protein
MIDFQGAPVSPKMSLEKVNKERAKIQGIEELRYWNKELS